MSVTVPRAVNPVTNPAGLLAAAGAVLAAVVMITNAIHNHGIIDSTVVIAAIGAVGALFTRQTVTPVADPKDAIGRPLVPVTPPPPGAITIIPAATQPVPVIPEPPVP